MFDCAPPSQAEGKPTFHIYIYIISTLLPVATIYIVTVDMFSEVSDIHRTLSSKMQRCRADLEHRFSNTYSEVCIEQTCMSIVTEGESVDI